MLRNLKAGPYFVLSWLVPFAPSKQHVEVEQEMAAVVSEEGSVLGIGDVAVDLERIEMVGKIHSAY